MPVYPKLKPPTYSEYREFGHGPAFAWLLSHPKASSALALLAGLVLGVPIGLMIFFRVWPFL